MNKDFYVSGLSSCSQSNPEQVLFATRASDIDWLERSVKNSVESHIEGN